MMRRNDGAGAEGIGAAQLLLAVHASASCGVPAALLRAAKAGLVMNKRLLS